MPIKHRIKAATSRFKKEFRRQIRIAFAAAVGFLIAYSWREYVFSLAKSLTGDMSIVMPNISNFLAALIITLIGAILIFISSKLLD